MKKEKETIQNLKYLLNKNRDFIERVVASESALIKINNYQDIINLDVVGNDETGETLELEGIPVILSQMITKNMLLEMKNKESIVLSLEE